jgi:hypothetical protein|tara:strand:- start:427 stop:606 length:180 start_codon:yes stop_codon:yes gene_type:complete
MPKIKDTAKVILSDETRDEMVYTWNAFNLDVTKERKRELMGLVWIPAYVNCFFKEMIDS